MVEKDFDELAGLMADVIIRNRKAGPAVSAYRRNFRAMKFCLPVAEAVPLAAKVAAAIFPNPGVAALFAENLGRAVEG